MFGRQVRSIDDEMATGRWRDCPPQWSVQGRRHCAQGVESAGQHLPLPVAVIRESALMHKLAWMRRSPTRPGCRSHRMASDHGPSCSDANGSRRRGGSPWDSHQVRVAAVRGSRVSSRTVEGGGGRVRGREMEKDRRSVNAGGFVIGSRNGQVGRGARKPRTIAGAGRRGFPGAGTGARTDERAGVARAVHANRGVLALKASRVRGLVKGSEKATPRHERAVAGIGRPHRGEQCDELGLSRGTCRPRAGGSTFSTAGGAGGRPAFEGSKVCWLRMHLDAPSRALNGRSAHERGSRG